MSLNHDVQWAQNIVAQLNAADARMGRQIAGVISTRQDPHFVKLDRLANTVTPPSPTIYIEAR